MTVSRWLDVCTVYPGTNLGYNSNSRLNFEYMCDMHYRISLIYVRRLKWQQFITGSIQAKTLPCFSYCWSHKRNYHKSPRYFSKKRWEFGINIITLSVVQYLIDHNAVFHSYPVMPSILKLTQRYCLNLKKIDFSGDREICNWLKKVNQAMLIFDTLVFMAELLI